MGDVDLNPSELNMLRDKTHLNPNLIIDYYKTFLNKYPNGRITKVNFIQDIVLKLIINNQSSAKDTKKNDLYQEKIKLSERLFDICDQDESGSVDFTEYFMLFWARVKGSVLDKLSIMFEMYDLNGSGEIDFNELHSIVKSLLKLKYSDEIGEDDKFKKFIFNDESVNSKLPLSYNIAMYIMKKLDTNKNAKLTKDEFTKGCLSNENIRTFLTPLSIL